MQDLLAGEPGRLGERAGTGPVPVRRRLPGDGLPRRGAAGAQRTRLPAPAGLRVVGLRRLARRWGARAGLAAAAVRRGTGRAENLDELVLRPLREMAGRDVDKPSVLGGLLTPRQRISDRVADAYREHLFGDATLQDLPDAPRFVFCATNLQTTSLFRFSKRTSPTTGSAWPATSASRWRSRSARRRRSRPICRRRRCGSPPTPGTRRSRRSCPRASGTRSCSPTAASTTTSAWSR